MNCHKFLELLRYTLDESFSLNERQVQEVPRARLDYLLLQLLVLDNGQRIDDFHQETDDNLRRMGLSRQLLGVLCQVEAVEEHQDELFQLFVRMLELKSELVSNALVVNRLHREAIARLRLLLLLEVAQDFIVDLEHHLQMAEKQWETASDVSFCDSVHLALECVFCRLKESQTEV